MADEVLVYAEHHDGKLTRPTWEAVAAGQQLARELQSGVSAVILGENLSRLASELAALELSEVLSVASPLLANYTADGTTHALKKVIQDRKPRYVIFSHTYQARDFAPSLAAALDRGFISDCLAYRKEGARLIFVRQVFQGKYNADVEFAGEPPYLASFQSGAFREDAARRGSAAAKSSAVQVSLLPEMVRTRPGERFREAKQAVDLTQAEIIVAVGGGINGPEDIQLANKLGERPGAGITAPRPTSVLRRLPAGHSTLTSR